MALDKGLATHLTLCDLSRAFDTVNHALLLRKMEHYGIRDVGLNFLSDYLRDRHQMVEWDGKLSSQRLVDCGIFQGTTTGPVLFILYINDIISLLGDSWRTQTPSVNSTSVIPVAPKSLYQYADDTSALVIEDTEIEATRKSNLLLSTMEIWFHDNLLHNNTDKMEVLIFNLSQKISDIKSAKLLGLIIDSRLRWHEHINTLSKRLASINYLFYKIRDQVSTKVLIMIYRSLFESVATYAIRFWGSVSLVDLILRRQKNAIRILTNSPSKEHCKPLFVELKILTIPALYVLAQIRYMRTNIEKYTLANDIHTYVTRHALTGDIVIPRYRTTKARDSPESVAIRLYNKIPPSIRNLPLRDFLAAMEDFLLKNPIYKYNEFYNLEIPPL